MKNMDKEKKRKRQLCVCVCVSVYQYFCVCMCILVYIYAYIQYHSNHCSIKYVLRHNNEHTNGQQNIFSIICGVAGVFFLSIQHQSKIHVRVEIFFYHLVNDLLSHRKCNIFVVYGNYNQSGNGTTYIILYSCISLW